MRFTLQAHVHSRFAEGPQVVGPHLGEGCRVFASASSYQLAASFAGAVQKCGKQTFRKHTGAKTRETATQTCRHTPHTQRLSGLNDAQARTAAPRSLEEPSRLLGRTAGAMPWSMLLHSTAAEGRAECPLAVVTPVDDRGMQIGTPQNLMFGRSLCSNKCTVW